MTLLVFQMHVTDNWDVVMFVTVIGSELLGVPKMQCTGRVSCDQMIIQYTHEEYCNMLLTLGTCNSRARAAAQKNTQRHPDAYFAPWRSIPVRQET
jgi:hypothetical protein